MSRLIRRLTQQVGHRGVHLLFVGLVSAALAFACTFAPSTTQSLALGRLIPLWIWGVMWAVTAALCIVQAFVKDDRLAFVAAVFMYSLWSMLYLVAWLAGLIERGWLSTIIWLFFAGLNVSNATWSENQRPSRP